MIRNANGIKISGNAIRTISIIFALVAAITTAVYCVARLEARQSYLEREQGTIKVEQKEARAVMVDLQGDVRVIRVILEQRLKNENKEGP